ncbi:MAG: DEAD/DEAH box helicase [Spirochaetales bacterium]|nr:DEAD/DEAH box helicase [Spirochaetales bacterium]
MPVTDRVISNHLKGEKPGDWNNGRPRSFVLGVYPLLEDETCWFLAVDFDKEKWQQDVKAFLETCREEGISAYLERSRSGNGGHVWIFFEEVLPAKLARNLGTALMTRSLDRRPEIGLDSFDRFFPNQDTMPKGGLGNLIALPLQKKAREYNHSIFIDGDFSPYEDQWKFLDSIERMRRQFVESFVASVQLGGGLLPVTYDRISEIENVTSPWESPAKGLYPDVKTPLPDKIEVVLSNQVFISSTSLPAVIRNRILRLASFSNPEFYKAQAMRLPTWNKPRILYCYEQHEPYIALPIGCLDALLKLLAHYKIKPEIIEKRNKGVTLDVEFKGELHPEQLKAARALYSKELGVLSATTAFGKTVVALWLIAQRKVNTLILVHRKQLMEQWVERITQFLGIPKKDIGCFGGGKKKRKGTIDVAVIQSVSKKGQVEEWIKEYGQIIVDECHHISAFSFEQAIRQSSAFYKVGLSATLTRNDGQQPIIFMNLGPVRYHVSPRKQALKRSFSHRVIIKNTDFMISDADKASQNIQELFKTLLLDKVRNQMIVEDIKKAVEGKRQILLLTERTEHLEILKGMLEEDVDNLFVLKGGLGRKQLKKIMTGISEVEEGKNILILATGKYLGEGFDLPALDTLFLTFPVSWKGTLTQYAGRLHREYHLKKEVIIYDYVDQNIPVLIRMHNKRLKGYEYLGYSVE